MNEFCYKFMLVINTSYRHDNSCHFKRSAHQSTKNTDRGNCQQDQSYNHTRIKKLCIPAFKGCMQWKTALCTTHERDSVSHVKFHLKKKLKQNKSGTWVEELL